MNKNNDISFAELISIINSGKSYFNDDQIIIEYQSEVDSGHIQSLLEAIGYDFDSVRTIRSNKITISLNAASWSSDCPIYANWDSLYTKVSTSSILPSYFYVAEGKSSSFDDSFNYKKLDLFCKTRKLLARLSDHCDPESGPAMGSRKLIFVIEAEKSVAKHEFKPSVSWKELQLIENPDNSLQAIEDLFKFIDLGDSHESERRNVLRSALGDLISGCSDQNDIFHTVLKSSLTLKKKYEEHYELFVKKFSVNKVLQEINEQDLTYTSKINEIVSSAQNKALTIPGALIAIGAIMRIDQVIDGIAVAIGIFVTTVIVHRSISVHQSTIEHLIKQVNADFKRYDTLNESAEVREQSITTKDELGALLSKATGNSKFIKKCIWFVFLSSILFIFSSGIEGENNNIFNIISDLYTKFSEALKSE